MQKLFTKNTVRLLRPSYILLHQL